MPEKKSPHLWIWITIILLVVIVLVVIFVIQDQKKFDESVPAVDFTTMTAPEYNYSEQDRVRIEQEISESNELFFDAFSGENTNDVENTSETSGPVIDTMEQEKVQKSNEEFMNMFNQSNI
jgi:hypothetical protein